MDGSLAVHVQEGQRVTTGEKLVELEPFDLLQREQEAANSLAALEAEYARMLAGFRAEEIAQAKARYEQFQARYDLLVAGPRRQEIEAAKGRVQLADSEMLLAEQNYSRAQTIVERKGISPRRSLMPMVETTRRCSGRTLVRRQELDLLEVGTREEEKREARARLDEAEQAWNLTKNGYRKEEIEKAKAARDAASSALAVIREQKKELVITCPIDGVIEALDLQKGDLVPSGGPVLSVMDDSQLWVRAYVPQNRVGLQIGQNYWSPSTVFRKKAFRASSPSFLVRRNSPPATRRRRRNVPSKSSASRWRSRTARQNCGRG